MKVVIDTNIFLAGLLRDSTTREILSSECVDFFLPEYSFSEIRNHKEELIEKSRYDYEEFDEIFLLLLENIKLVPKEVLKEYMGVADEIMKNIDLDDSPFIATALAIKADGIWSFDKHFSMQNKIKVITTNELKEKV